MSNSVLGPEDIEGVVVTTSKCPAGERTVRQAPRRPQQIIGERCGLTDDRARRSLGAGDGAALADLEPYVGTWQIEARVKVGGGGFRWCECRGRAWRDDGGKTARAAGVVADVDGDGRPDPLKVIHVEEYQLREGL